MAKVTEAQAVEGYEKTLERWLGDVSQKDIDKVLELMGKMDKLPYARLPKLYLDLCAHCGACANQCHIYRAYPSKELNPAYRTKLLRAVYRRHFTLIGKIFRGLIGAKKLDQKMLKEWFIRFYQCNQCRRCAIFCPFGIDIGTITRTGRVFICAAMGKTTEDMGRGVRYHLRDGNASEIKEKSFFHIISFWEEEIKEKRGWEIKVPIDREGAEMFVVPPNTDFFHSLETMEGIAATLYAAKADWTMSSKIFDSVNYGIFYDDDALVKIRQMQIEEAKRLKCKMLVVGECGHATRALMELPSALRRTLPFEVKNILQITADYIKQGKIKLNKEANPEPVTFHDSCHLSRKLGIIEEPRLILKAACKDFREMVPNRDKNYCCGGGAGVVLETASHDYRVEVTGRMKVDQIKQTGAKVVAAVCANCKVELSHLIDYHGLDVRWSGVHDLVLNALEL